MFNEEERDDSSLEDLLEPSDDEAPAHTLPAIEDTDNLIFKLSVYINSPTRNLNYQIYFLSFPSLEIKSPNKGVTMIFPMSPEELCSYITPSLDITALENEKYKGSCSIDVSEQIASLCKETENSPAGFPITCNQQEKETLIGEEGNPVAEIDVQFEVVCVGPTLVEDAVVDELGLAAEGGKENYQESKDQEDYDEYCAEVNGHSLNIKMLRKKKDCRPLAKKGEEKSQKGEIPPGGVGRKNSQIIFQMPSNQALCTKSPPNAVMYNVGTCKEGDHHGHGPEQIKVLPGNTEKGTGDKSDCFVIKIGKKSNGENGRGRLELELKAPKPVGPEDFKKPLRDATTQTEASEKNTKKGGSKKKTR